MIFVNIGFTSHAIISIMLIINFFKSSSDPWYCIWCRSQIFPFNSVKINKNFFMCINKLSNANKANLKNESSLLLKPSPNLKILVNQFNDATLENKNIILNSDNVVHSKYHDTEELQNMKRPKINHRPYFI